MNNWIKMPDPDRIETKRENSEADKVISDTKEELTEFADRVQVEAIVDELNLFINPLDLDKKGDLVDYILAWKLWSNEKIELENMARYMIYWLYSWGTTTPQVFSYQSPQSSSQLDTHVSPQSSLQVSPLYTQKNRFSPEGAQQTSSFFLENKFARKLKYILDNHWKDIKTILSGIKKEVEKRIKATQLPESNQRPVTPAYRQKKEKWGLEWLISWAYDRIKQWIEDIYDYWTEKLSDLWNMTINSLVPDGIKNGVKDNVSRVKNWIRDNLFSPEKQKNTETINEIYQRLKWPEKPDFFPFYLAMQWYNKQRGSLWNAKYLTVVDYSKSVSQRRLFVINMETLTVENCVRTWHGKKSGNQQSTTSFSNTPNSNQTSIGFFRTPQDLRSNSWRTWKWLFLNWKEYSNDKSLARWIAMHPVWSFFYSKSGWNRNHTRYHRAWESTSDGCITILSVDNPNEIMDKIKWDSLIYSYYPDMTYLSKSELIR